MHRLCVSGSVPPLGANGGKCKAASQGPPPLSLPTRVIRPVTLCSFPVLGAVSVQHTVCVVKAASS